MGVRISQRGGESAGTFRSFWRSGAAVLGGIGVAVALTGCGGGGAGSGLSSAASSDLSARARSGASSPSPSPSPSPSCSPSPVPSGAPGPRPSVTPAPMPSGTPVSGSNGGTNPTPPPPGGLVTGLKPGVCFLLMPPGATSTSSALCVQFTASTPVVFPDGTAATLSNGEAVQVQGSPGSVAKTFEATKITVVPTVGKTANVASAAGTFDLLPAPPPAGKPGANGSGGQQGSGAGTSQPSPSSSPLPAPRPLHVVTNGSTEYEIYNADCSETATTAASVTNGVAVGVFGIVDPKAGTLNATEVDLLPPPPANGSGSGYGQS